MVDQGLTEIIALAPLSMVLVRAKDEREKNAFSKAVLKSAAEHAACGAASLEEDGIFGEESILR